MKGFEINYKGNITKVMANNGMITIHIYDLNGSGHIYAGNIEYLERQRNIWYDNMSIELGDKFEIKVCEIDQMSEPIISKEDKTIERPMSKLENFRRMEAHLKEQGLL